MKINQFFIVYFDTAHHTGNCIGHDPKYSIDEMSSRSNPHFGSVHDKSDTCSKKEVDQDSKLNTTTNVV